MDDLGLVSTAHSLRVAIAAGLSDADLIRLVIQAADDFNSVVGVQAQGAFLAEPPSTGDPRYDALLAGLAVYLARRAGLTTTPAWTRAPSRYLSVMWWPGLDESSGLRAYALQRAPAYMKARGVLLNVENFESV